MALIRGTTPSDQFLQIRNEAVRDGRLTHKARGVLAEIMSHAPGWKTSIERLAKAGVDGETAIKSAMKELEQYGYLLRVKARNPDGTWRHDQYITDSPGTAQPPVENPPVDKWPAGNPPI